MTKVTINETEIELGPGERLNGIEAARRAGIEIPHYCWHPGLSVVASCRMCLVEAGRRDPQTGSIQMQPKLVPACQTPATEGTVFVTDSPKVRQARAMVEEDLLLRHPIDCPICDKAGECYLQDYHFQYGQPERRADLKPFTSRRRPMGETVTLFVDRCVMCTRCVRFTREITGTHELMIVDRGSHEEIDVFPGYPLANKMSGNVVDLCPVGALGDTDFLYSQRVWFMQSRAHVCAGCSTGCSIWVESNQDRIYRLKPRENPQVNQWWICDEGRYGFHHVHDVNRLVEARRRTPDEGHEVIPAFRLPELLDGSLRSAGRLAVALSPHLTVEEAYLLVKYIRSLDPEALVAMGPTPQIGVDESYPRGFTIRAEKCPNRRGVAQIAARFAGELVEFDQFLARVRQEAIRGAWISGGYTGGWISDEELPALAKLELLIVQDLFSSPLSEQATIQLPSVAFAERAGSYVNACDRLQSFDWSIRPPAGVLSEGQLLWRLLGRQGLYRPAQVLQEIAREIPFFSAASGAIPAHGLDLRIHLLAEV